MAETDYTLAVRVQAYLRAAGLPAPPVPDIVPALSTARESVARRIAEDEGRRRELRPDVPFQIVVAAGVAPLSTLLAAPNRLLLEFLKDADVRDPAGLKLYYVARSRYEMTLPAAYGYFTVEGETFFARFKGDAVGASAGTCFAFANFAPEAGELPDSCVADVVAGAAAMLAPPPPPKQGGRAR